MSFEYRRQREMESRERSRIDSVTPIGEAIKFLIPGFNPEAPG